MTQDELKSLLHYDPNTGIFTWLVSPSKRTKIGSLAGPSTNTDYRRISIKYKLYLEHRLAWLYVHGDLDPQDIIDHIDRNIFNNKIENLRKVSKSENCQNRGKNKNNKSQYMGVHFDKSTSKHHAQIGINGKKKYLGQFKTPEEAHQAYLKAKAELHIFNPS